MVITIDREYGSGGHIIGQKLAEDLNIPFYDNEILREAARESGMCEEIFENYDEKNTSSFLYSLVMDPLSFGFNSSSFEMPVNYKVFLSTFDAIRELASKGDCVFVGRCADYALSDSDIPHFDVFIHATMESRIERATKIYGIRKEHCEEYMKKMDKERAHYYNYYTSNRWGDSKHYDLCFDSSKYGIHGSVDLIRYAIELKEKRDKQ